MSRTFLRQINQLRSSDTYDDTIAPTLAAYETNPAHIETDLNNLRSMTSNLKDVLAGNWYDALVTPGTLETGTQRGVDNLNTGLHAVEKKRVMRCVDAIVDITVGAATNFHILLTGQLPPNTTAAVGAVTTLGTIVADHNAAFGAHSLLEVGGGTAISPKNMLEIVDGSTRDPITSAGGDRIYALLQSETAADGHTITDTTTTRVQLSFVKINATGDDLIAAVNADIENAVINVCWNERVRFEDLTEQDFLRGGVADVPSGATVTRQVGYDNQGTTPVDQTTNATLDLEGPGLVWSMRDDLEAELFAIVEGSAGGTSTVRLAAGVDVFDNNAIVNDFASGATINSGGTRPITVGVTDGEINTTAGALRLEAFTLLEFGDGFETASAFDTPLVLSDSSAEWDAFETAFGEVSILNAITQAANASTHRKVQAAFSATVAADVDVSGPATDNNIDTNLGDLSGGTFVTDYDFFYNGTLLRNGANAAANEDVYPGTSLALGQLKFEFQTLSTPGLADKLTLIAYA